MDKEAEVKNGKGEGVMETGIRGKVFVAAVALVVSLIVLMPNYNCTFVSYVRADSDVSFYVLGECERVPRFCTSVDVGKGAVVKCKGAVAEDVSKSLDAVAGVSFCFSGGQDEINEFLEGVDAVVLKCENIADITSYFAYSKKLKNGIRVDGELVNLQIAKCGNTITIGSPIILGEY